MDIGCTDSMKNNKPISPKLGMTRATDLLFHDSATTSKHYWRKGKLQRRRSRRSAPQSDLTRKAAIACVNLFSADNLMNFQAMVCGCTSFVTDASFPSNQDDTECENSAIAVDDDDSTLSMKLTRTKSQSPP
jgi:hypothetical protein